MYRIFFQTMDNTNGRTNPIILSLSLSPLPTTYVFLSANSSVPEGYWGSLDISSP